MINGGVRNRLLMQIIADALDHDILVGIPWASLGGNFIIQMCSTGLIDKKDLAEVCSNSFKLEKSHPKDSKRWPEKYAEMLNSKFFVLD